MSTTPSPESSRLPESLQELCDIVKPHLERVGSFLSENDVHVTYVPCHDLLERVAGSKGIVLRPFEESLEDIRISGLDPQQALDRALDQILGEDREVPADAPEQGIYVVELDFAYNHDGKFAIPTLMLGKVQRTDEALDELILLYEDILLEPGRPKIRRLSRKEVIARYSPGMSPCHDVFVVENAEGRVIDDTDYRAFIHQQRRLASQDNVKKGLEEIKRLRHDVQRPPLAVWRASGTDMSFVGDIFGLNKFAEGAKIHLMQVPPRLNADRTVDEGRGEVREAISGTA